MTVPTASPVAGSERERFRPPRLTGGATSSLLALGGRDRGNWGGPRTRLWPIRARPLTSAARGGARARCQGSRGGRGRSGRVIGPPAITRARPDLATAAPPGDRRAPRGPWRAPRRVAVLSGRRAAPGPCSLPGEKNPEIDLRFAKISTMPNLDNGSNGYKFMLIIQNGRWCRGIINRCHRLDSSSNLGRPIVHPPTLCFFFRRRRAAVPSSSGDLRAASGQSRRRGVHRLAPRAPSASQHVGASAVGVAGAEARLEAEHRLGEAAGRGGGLHAPRRPKSSATFRFALGPAPRP
jgi:hypothetical protein